MLIINKSATKLILIYWIMLFCFPQTLLGQENKTMIDLGAELLFEVKSGKDYSNTKNKIENYDLSLMMAEINSDILKKAFWINIYNAFVLLQLKKNESVYEQKAKFFKTKNIIVAQKKLSLDDIEHKILRNNANKISLGYLKSIFTAKEIKKMKINHLDARIHFALNCGAASCPPIAFYDHTNLDDELNIAVSSYFINGLEIKENIIFLPKFMSWFRGDFNGKKGLKDFLVKQHLLPSNQSHFKIKFKDYDWSVKLNNFRGF